MTSQQGIAQNITLELCAGGIEDVLLAASRDVDRIELNSGMAVSGLTPSEALVVAARREFTKPIIAMIRPREGGFRYSSAEFRLMLDDADRLLQHGIDGIAIGLLNDDGTIDESRTREVRRRFQNAELVFHKAFDVTPNLDRALKTLIDCGFDRVLTSGGKASAEVGAEEIARLIQQSNQQIEILPGGGIRAANVRALLQRTASTQIHSAVRETCVDVSTQHNPVFDFGLPGQHSGTFGRASLKVLDELLAAVRSDAGTGPQ